MKGFNCFFLNAKWLLITMFTLTFFVNCNEEDDPIEPVASFQYEIGATNFLEVAFTNYSQNATSYAWDFGDSNTSTDESPTHTYATTGDYTVSLTATGADGLTTTKTEAITIADPDASLTLLAGTSSKTWYIQRENIAIGIGPEIGAYDWWSFGGVTPLGDRPCILDDKYIFHRDGTFEFQSNGTIFIDAEANGGWLGPDAAESCYDENTETFTTPSGQDVSAFGDGGSYTYEFNQASNSLTLLGEGAYIGLASKTAAGDVGTPIATKGYTIATLAEGDIADSLQLAIVGDGFVWTFNLVSYENESNLPAIPTAVPVAAFNMITDGYMVTFANSSANATSYAWDFGDGNTSTEMSPVHTYATEGVYTVTLTITDDAGVTDVTTQEVVISAATFSAATLQSATGKAWRLAGEASYVVGSYPGSNEWWPGLDAAAIEMRACQMNDEYIFFDNGDYTYATSGDVFHEDYMAGANECIDESALTAPFDLLAGNTHTFEVVEGDDVTQITVFGQGAFVGFSKPYNGGELAADAIALPEQITYNVLDYTNTPEKETLTLTLDISEYLDGTAWWTIKIESLN